MKKFPRLLLFVTLLAFLCVCILLGFMFGSVSFDLMEILRALFTDQGDNTVTIILFTIRIPRIFAAFLAGAGLAVSGLLFQTATNNDLCSPNVMGVNAGAGFAVMLFMCFFPMAFQLFSLAAFLGATATTVLVLGISFSAAERTVRTKVVLAGVAIGTLFNAGISFLAQLYPDVLSSYTAFSMGGFQDVYMEELLIPAILILGGILLAELLAPKLNLLALGDDLASSLGTAVKPIRFLSLLLASLLCGAVVSFAGLLGFVGLIVPHIARKLIGHDVRLLIPVCVLCGSSLVILSDLAARTLFSPAELPAGILMAALGAPFFLYLLFRKKQPFS